LYWWFRHGKKDCRKRCYLEAYLAVAVAKISNQDKVKIGREFVKIGVGTNEENIAEWIDFIWKKFKLTDKDDYQPK